MISYNDFFIGRIYTVVKKTEKECFQFENSSREWDGFVLLIDGEGTFIDNESNTYPYVPGDVILLGRGYHYHINLPQGGTYITSAFDIHFDGFEKGYIFPQLLHLNAEMVEQFRVIEKTFFSYEENSIIQSRILLTNLYVELLSMLEPSANLSNKEAIAAEKIVRRTFRENLSVENIAKQCNISTSYLRACFLRTYGMSLTRYREKLRIEEAEILIRSGFFKLNEIAEQLGYCDIFHFTKNFTKAKGISPSKYREMYQ